MERDKGKKGKISKKRKKGKKGSKKGKKKKDKDLTPDRTTESLFEELIMNNVIKPPPQVSSAVSPSTCKPPPGQSQGVQGQHFVPRGFHEGGNGVK